MAEQPREQSARPEHQGRPGRARPPVGEFAADRLQNLPITRGGFRTRQALAVGGAVRDLFPHLEAVPDDVALGAVEPVDVDDLAVAGEPDPPHAGRAVRRIGENGRREGAQCRVGREGRREFFVDIVTLGGPDQQRLEELVHPARRVGSEELLEVSADCLGGDQKVFAHTHPPPDESNHNPVSAKWS